MALRNPYDFPQDPETHPLGERIVSVADPLESAPGARTFYLSRRFTFPEGDYTFIVEADDAATVWIGTSQLNARIIATPTLAVPARADVNIPAGEYRLDVILQNLTPGPSPAYFTMVIMRGEEVFYTSAKEAWLLDDTAINDNDLPPSQDIRYTMPVWTTMPNWLNGITERLSWQTDILDSERDAEQRRSVRRNARRSFEASFLRDAAGGARMDAFLVGVGPAPFLLPLWHEQVRMVDGLDMEASGVTFPDGELRLREFRKGDLVLVNNGDPNDWDLLEIGDVDQDRFSWKSPPPRAWPVGTRIFPLRVARVDNGDARTSGVTDTVRRAEVRFTLDEPYVIEPSWGGTGGEPIFGFNVDRATTLDVEYSRKAFVIDNTSGKPTTTDHGKHTSAVVQTRLKFFGRPQAFRFRQFLQAARGMARHFYAPTFMQDIYPVGDVIGGTNELIVQPQGFRRSMLSPQPIRLQIAFQFRDGAPTIYADIVNVQEVYQSRRLVAEVLTLAEPLPEITMTDLRRISFVCETRFAQDSFEIHHPTNGQAVIDVACVLRQATNPRTIPA
jgi:hypothetical protein